MDNVVCLGMAALLLNGACLGARMGTVKFSVVDEEGNPIPGALGEVGFITTDALLSIRPRRVRTDKNGQREIRGLSYGEVIFRFSREGYYTTNGRVWFRRWKSLPDGVVWQQDRNYGQNFWPTEDPGDDGPWVMSCPIVLKKTVKPHP